MNYTLLTSKKIFHELTNRGFSYLSEKNDLEELTYEIAVELNFWLLDQFEINQSELMSNVSQLQITIIRP